MGLIYRNRFILNQRGGSLLIDNTTDQEKVKLSQRSGSNINLTNFVNSELATNNKQVLVVNDFFETVLNNRSQVVGNNSTERTSGNTYTFNGFSDKKELELFTEWKEAYKHIAKNNSQFRIYRGGVGYPEGSVTELDGEREENPTMHGPMVATDNLFIDYDYSNGVSIRTSQQDDVVAYAKVTPSEANIATLLKPSAFDIGEGAGDYPGSIAPGVKEFTPYKSAATEGGDWVDNPIHMASGTVISWEADGPKGSIESPDNWDDNDVLRTSRLGGGVASYTGTVLGVDICKTHSGKLVKLEQEMGDFGDVITLTKRNKFEQVGAEFNDYPSVRIDDKGRSQPLEIVVCARGSFKNHDYFPHVEEVDNAANFPCGNDDKVVGNRYSRTVGSGGVNLKTTGTMEMGGTVLKTGFKRVYLNASHGIVIASERGVDIQSLKSITLRTNRQVYVEGALGIRNNLIVGGGAYVEGELYCHHITAPLEVHKTEDTIVLGKFTTDISRNLVIGETLIGDEWYPVYALPDDDLIVNYPHSHHHNGIAMRLTDSNQSVRKFARNEAINHHTTISTASPTIHQHKSPQKPVSDEEGG